MRLLLAILAILPMIRPDYLRPGDKVAIISPSYAITDSVALRRGCDALRSWGLEPVMGKYVYLDPVNDSKGRSRNVYAGTLEQRLEDLKWAYEADSIKAIVCARGGYGGIQLLPMLPLSTYSEHPKWLVGFSDITNFIAASTMAGVMSIHGNMISSIGAEKVPNEYSIAMKDMLFGNVPGYGVEHNEHDVPGHATGVLVGGNMITYQALLGTRYDTTQLEDVILFFEEVEESMHAIDRILNAMMLQGRLGNVKGIIVGIMHKCGKELMTYEDVYDVLSQYTADFGIPVCYGFPSGHGKVNMPLMMGAEVTLDVTEEGSTIKYNL
ncbi:MAG: LD-carboxypeptidase [Bacteroidales bacterium]|nr:LD-carboxypeptidase [Bacteroidales bacterium]